MPPWRTAFFRIV